LTPHHTVTDECIWIELGTLGLQLLFSHSIYARNIGMDKRRSCCATTGTSQ
jgi:hypothetical protein